MILSQNRIHAKNPSYKTYEKIMNEAERFKPLKPGQHRVHYEENKRSPWLHPHQEAHPPRKNLSSMVLMKKRVWPQEMSHVLY